MQVKENDWLGVQHPSSMSAITSPRTAGRCQECDNLWKESFDALGEHLRILAERDAARKRKDHDLVEAFEEIEKESVERCESARDAISNHEVTHLLENLKEGAEAPELQVAVRSASGGSY